jgi:hypothetical protein
MRIKILIIFNTNGRKAVQKVRWFDSQKNMFPEQATL